MLDFQVDNFWNWFEENANQLHSDNYDTTPLSELDKTISSWGFGWEIGPPSLRAMRSNLQNIMTTYKTVFLLSTNCFVPRSDGTIPL